MQAIELFRVMGKLALDKGEFSNDIKEADSEGKGLSEKLSSYMQKAKKFIVGLGIAAGIKKVAGDIWNLAKETSAAGDRIDKQSQAIGMSRKAFQEWDYILSQSGASIDNLGLSMKTMGAAIDENSAETAAGLSRLGLSAAHLQSLEPEKQFEALVRAFQKMPAGSQKSALALQLFGRNAQSLMPLLNSSSDSIDELREQAEKLGLIMSDEDVNASVAFGDALDDLTRTWQSFKMKIGAQFLPGFTSGLKTSASMLGELSSALVAGFKTGDFSTFFNTLTIEIGQLIPGLVDKTVNIITGIFKNADKLVGLAVSVVTGVTNGIITSIPILIAKLPTIIDTIWSGMKSLIEGLGNTIIGLLNDTFKTNIPEIDLSGIQSAFQWFVDNKDLIVSAVTAIIGAFVASKIAAFVASLNPLTIAFGLVAGAISLVAANWDKIKGWIGKAWETTVTWVQNAWKDVENAFAAAGKWVGKTWKTTVEWAQKAWADVSSAFKVAGEWVNKTWKTTVSWINNGWNTVSDAFKKAGEWVSNKVHEIAVNWKSTVDDWLKRINDWLNNKTVGEIAADIKANVAEWFETIKNWISGTSIGKATLDFIANVGEWFNRVFKWIGGTSIGKATLDFVANVGEWFNIVKGWLESTEIGNATINFIANIGEWFKRIWEWISSKTPQQIKAKIGVTVDEWLERVKGWLDETGITNFTLKIGSTVSEWIQRINDWITNGIRIAVNFVSGAVEGLTNDSGVFQGGDSSGLGWGESLDVPQVPGWGGYAKGLNYVPYDGYRAILHRGETILNQAQGRAYRAGEQGGINTRELYQAVASAVSAAVSGIRIDMDGKQVGNAVTEQVSRNIYQAQYGRRVATL